MKSLFSSARVRIVRRGVLPVLFALGGAAGAYFSGADARAQSVGFNTNAALLEEVQKDAPSLERVRHLLSDANPPANPNTPDSNNVPVVAVAAKLGHAEVVSVLITAGASPTARDPSFHDTSIPHLMAAHDAPPNSTANKWEVLQSFSAALDAISAEFDWNLPDQNNSRPLELLRLAEENAANDDARAIVREMSAHMIFRGASCRKALADSHKHHPTCIGSAGVSLAALVNRAETPDNHALTLAMQAVRDSGLEVSLVGISVGALPPVAAFFRHVDAVSILLTAGFDPDGRLGTRSVLHQVGRKADLFAPEMLEVLRSFIDGLHATGQTDSFDGWNGASNVGRPLEALESYATEDESLRSVVREIQALMYERGAECANPGSATHCQIPTDEISKTDLREGVDSNFVGDVLTLYARDYGGATFTLAIPDAGKTAELESQGWTLRAEADSPPHRVVLSRSRATNEGSEAHLTVTMLAAGGRAAREFRVSISLFGPVLTLLRGAAREGNVALLRQLGDEIGARHFNATDFDGVTPLLAVAATLGHAEAVSVLITAGYNPAARLGRVPHSEVPHLLATAQTTLSAARRLAVMRSFGDAVETRGTLYDWNQEDSSLRHPLDLLRSAYDAADRAEREVVLQVSDYMLRKGAGCRHPNSYGLVFHPACVGPLGVALGELVVNPAAPAAAEVAAAARAITEAGISLNLMGVSTDRGGILHEAVYYGHAEAVSVLVAAGFDPNLEADGYYPLSWIALFGAAGERDGDAGLNVTPDMPEVLRHFIGGLHAAGLADSFDGWNAASLYGAPLDDLNENQRPDNPAANEVHALMYERGGRCADSEGVRFCEVPVENVLAGSAADFSGPVLTLFARDFGGAVFSMPAPDSEKTAELAASGWTLHADSSASPERVVLFRVDGKNDGKFADAVFTITMMSPQHGAAREFRVRTETSSGDAAALRAAVRRGDAGEIGELLFKLGTAYADAVDDDGATPLLLVATELGHAEAVSVLITAGASPTLQAERGAFLHYVALDSAGNSEAMLRVLRAFIGAMHSAGRLDSFDGWSDTGGWRNDSPMEYIADIYDEVGNPNGAMLEIRGLMYERGARCNSGATNGWCGVPVEEVGRGVLLESAFVGDVLTVLARDFGGITFSLSFPDVSVRATLESRGWILRAESEATPAAVVLSRETAATETGDADFAITMTSPAHGAARIFEVRAEVAGASLAVDTLRRAAMNSEHQVAREMLRLLGPSGLDLTHSDGGGPLLISVLARRDAAMVGILVSAGYNPNTRHPDFPLATIPHLIVRGEFGGHARRRWELLQSFGDAAAARGAAFDWNQVDDDGRRPLDLIRAEMADANLESAYEMIRMTDYMLLKGAECSGALPNEWKYHRSCIGVFGGRLAAAATTAGASAGEIRAAAQAAREAGVHPDIVGLPDAGSVLPVAAKRGRAVAVSVLIAEGANPRARADGFAVPHYAALLAQGDEGLTPAVEVLRHFIGGLHSAGLASAADIWDVESESGLRPLDVMEEDYAEYNQEEEDGHVPEVREVHSLMYERGARCGGSGAGAGSFGLSPFCHAPIERVRLQVPETRPPGAVLTLSARDFGGAVFTMPPPDAEKTAELQSSGWTLRASSSPGPEALVLSRAAGATPAAFTVTMMSADNQAAREFRAQVETINPALTSLRAAVAAGDAGRTRELTGILGPAYLDIPGEDGVTPLLIEAASMGHAEVVSVLVVAGHDPNARHPYFHDFNAAHIAVFYTESDPSAGWELLRHFGGAVDEVGAEFDWRGTGAMSFAPLDWLALQSRPESPGAIVLQMSDYILQRGGGCGGFILHSEYSDYQFAPACIGSFGLTLANEIARTEGPRDPETRAAVSAMLDAGLDPNIVGVFRRGLILPLAASLNYASAVSVLITAGLNPDGRTGDGLSALDHAARGAEASLALNVLRHFIGGLQGAGLADSFDGWNSASADAAAIPPLGALNRGANPDDIAANETHALIYERGGRCDPETTGKFCEVPIEIRAANVSGGQTGGVLTLIARDFGGAVFGMHLPDDAKASEISESGWTLRADDSASPARVVLSRARPLIPTDDTAVFTVTMTDAARETAREFRVWAGAGMSDLHSLRSAVWRGDAMEVATLLSTLGTTYANAEGNDGVTPILLEAANLQRAEIVSVLITAGADPAADTSVGGLPNIVARDADENPAAALEVLRYFIGGLHVAEQADEFDWNRRFPLDALARTSAGGATDIWEIQALMYERGARCDNTEGTPLCETPREWRGPETPVAENYVGDVMTIAARDFGGAVFSFAPLDAEQTQALEDSGWSARVQSGSGAARMILSRARARQEGDLSASFAFTAQTADGEEARVYRISACFETDEEIGGRCVPREGNFDGISQRELCGAFMGATQDVGGGAVCKGLDQRGTFCILDSTEVFPCRGLFKTARTCNFDHNRPLLSPALCDAKCSSGYKAIGGRCCLESVLETGACIAPGQGEGQIPAIQLLAGN